MNSKFAVVSWVTTVYLQFIRKDTYPLFFPWILAPSFTTSVPFVTTTTDGYSKIIGCSYIASTNLTDSSFLLINGTYRVNLTRQTATTSSPSSSQYEENSTNMESFQLPDTLLETAGTYQCGLDISNLLTPILSKNSVARSVANSNPWD